MTDDQHSGRASDDLAAAVHAHVAEIMAQAQAQADALQAEVEAATVHRATEVRMEAQEDAAAIRAHAQAEAAAYLDDARRRIDAFAQGRIQRLADLADELAGRAGELQLRLDQTINVKAQLDTLVAALGAAAQDAAAEASRAPVAIPGLGGTELHAVPAQQDDMPAEAVATPAAETPPAETPPAAPPPAAPPPAAPPPAATPARPLRQEAEAVRSRVRDAARGLPHRPADPPAPTPPRPTIPVRPPLPPDGE